MLDACLPLTSSIIYLQMETIYIFNNAVELLFEYYSRLFQHPIGRYVCFCIGCLCYRWGMHWWMDSFWNSNSGLLFKNINFFKNIEAWKYTKQCLSWYHLGKHIYFTNFAQSQLRVNNPENPDNNILFLL